MKLTFSDFRRAVDFVALRGRDVDRMLLNYTLEDAPASQVIKAVAQYQNDDGGFGNAIEPDFRLAASSVMATSVAFQYLEKVGADDTCPGVQKGVAYLLDTLDTERFEWQVVPPQIDDCPRAPWWNFSAWQGNDWANPGAECTAILMRHGSMVPGDILQSLTKRATQEIKDQPAQMKGHDLLCFLALAKAASEPLKSLVVDRLARSLDASVALEKADWQSYGLRPYWVVSDPAGLFYSELEGPLMENLGFEISTQQGDGSWLPFWEWEQFEETWQIARTEWQGQLTVKLLCALKALNMIEEDPL